MKKTLNVVELFAGIGGFYAGLQKSLINLNPNIVLASEIDKKTSEVYKSMYDIEPFGDVKEIEVDAIPNHDLLVGGFPCQSFSFAGKRQGFCDTRGTLFFEVIRISEKKKPKIIFLENVKGLLSHDNGQTLKIMLEELTRIGYHLDFKVLNSNFFGVPQTRERIYIIAIRNDLLINFEKKNEWDIKNLKNIELKTKEKLNDIHTINKFNFDFPKEIESNKTKLKDFLEEIKEPDTSISNEFKRKWLSDYPELKHIDSNTVYPFHSVQRKDVRNNGSRYRKNNIHSMYTLIVTDHHGIVYKNSNNETDFRMLTPNEMLKLQGFSSDLIHKALSSSATDRQLRMMAGNAVTVNVISEIASNFEKYLL